MASPIIFSGSYAKLLTPKGILNSDGSINQYDGNKNYINYAQFEQGLTTGWSLFNTTLTSGLPTGSIGSGAASLTLNTTSTNPIDGSYSLQVVAGTSWAAGQGYISDEITIDRGDYGKVLSFSFYFEGVSGATNANWSGVLGAQSLAVYIYDSTLFQWVQPAGFLGMNQSSGVGMVTGTFQTSVTAGQKYRIAVIALQSIANPITVNFDRFKLSPNQVVLGTPVTDWQFYTPTFNGFGTPTAVSCYWKRSGDSIEIKGKFTCGTSTAVQGQVSFPYNLTTDSTKISTIEIVGAAEVATLGAIGQSVSATFATLSEQSVQYITFSSRSSGTTGLSKLNGSSMMSSGTVLSFYARVPILGWSAASQVSSDTDTRVIAASKNTLSSTTITANTALAFTNTVYDTHGAVTSNTTYTIPVSGYYKVTVSGLAVTTTNTTINVYQNGIAGADLFTATTSVRLSGSVTVSAKAGDMITIVPNTNSTANGTSCSFYIERLSGPSVITATETVAVAYSASTNVTSNSTTPIAFDLKEYDTHNCVTTGPWKFTAPISGKYKVSVLINQTTAIASYLHIYKNGSIYKAIGSYNNTNAVQGIGSTDIQLNAGEYIDLRYSAGNTVQGGALNATSASSNIAILRIGN